MATANQVAATVIQFHPSSTSLTAKIHPLVLFNICDSYVRRSDQADRVIGTLFGSVSVDGTVDITNSYTVPHSESSDQTITAEINHKIGASGVVSQECKSVVAQYGQEILDMLLAQTQPLKICSHIGLCELDGTQGIGIGIESVVNMNGEKLSVGRSNAVCNACEMAVVWMQNQIKQNQTQEQILNYINELCDRLPSPMGESAVDCGALTSIPSITFTIGGKPFNLTAEQPDKMEALKQRLENTTVDSSNSQIRQESICSGDDYETVGNEEHAEDLT